MSLQRLNDFLTKGMIGVFASILPFSLLTLLLPALGYVVAFLLIVLMIVTAANVVVTTIAFVKQIIELLDGLQKTYEQYEREAGEY